MANTDRIIKYNPFNPGTKAKSYTPKLGENAAKQQHNQLKQWPGPKGTKKSK